MCRVVLIQGLLGPRFSGVTRWLMGLLTWADDFVPWKEITGNFGHKILPGYQGY